MKIIFLNTWNGKIKAGITEFIREHSRDTDIFCFQEVYSEMRLSRQDILADYQEFYAYKRITGDDFSQATYVSKKIKGVAFNVVLEGQKDCGFGVNVKISLKNRSVNVCNFHGRCKPTDKLDSPERLKQSQGLINFFKDKEGMKIIGGDFNLLPATRSIEMLKENGYKDLIKDFKIKTTRNRLAWEKYPDNKQYYADYVFVSRDANIKNFLVPDNEVSDHLPLILEIKNL